MQDGDVEEVSESSDSQSQLEYDKQVDLAKVSLHAFVKLLIFQVKEYGGPKYSYFDKFSFCRATILSSFLLDIYPIYYYTIQVNANCVLF